MGNTKQQADRTLDAERLKRILEAVRRIDRLIIRETDPATLLQGICEALAETGHYPAVWLATVVGGRLGELYAAGDRDATAGLARTIAATGTPPCAQTVLASGAALRLGPGDARCIGCGIGLADCGAMVLPIAADDRLYALLGVLLDAGQAPGGEAEQMLRDVAEQLGWAWQNRTVEDERTRAEAALRERVKELRCLYIISRILEGQDADVPELLTAVAEQVPSGFEWPGVTAAQIRLDDAVYGDPGGRGEKDTLRVPICVLGEERGMLVVWLREARPELDIGPFLAEERDLLAAIAERVARTIEQRETTAEIRRREHELSFRSALLNQIADRVTATDLEGNIVYVNDAVCDMLGRSRDDLLGKPVDILGEDPAEGATQAEIVAATLATGLWRGEVVNIAVDGQRIVLDCRTRLVHDESGEPIGMVGISTDISRLKRAQEAVRSGRRRYRMLFENAPVALLEEDFSALKDEIDRVQREESPADLGAWLRARPDYCRRLAGMVRVLRANREALRLYQASGVEDFAEGLAPLLLDEYLHTFADSLAAFAAGARRFACEKRNRTFAGEVRDLVLRLGLEPDSSDWSRILVSLEDITERKRAEQALRDSESRFRELFENMTSAVAIYDPVDDGADFLFRAVNHAAERICGRQREELFGRRLSAMFTGAGNIGLFDGLREAYRSGSSVDLGVSHYEDEGLSLWVENRIYPLPSGELVVVFDDQTASHRLQQQLAQAQKMEAIGQLAGGIAHDFNNILAGILGYAEMAMRRAREDQQLHSMVSTIRDASLRAGELTRQLLAFSRKQQLDKRPLDLNEAITAIEGMLGRLIGEHVALECDLSGEVPVVEADPSQMDQILLNLAINARDAMPEGGSLTITTRGVELDETYCSGHEGLDPGRYLLLSVSDTGHGMDAETQARIFEPFFTTKERGKGTGLGLATVYGIVRQHNGNIFVYSEPGMGATFKIYLPTLPQTVTPVTERPAERADVGGTETILLVEDEALVRNLAADILRAFGYTVHTAEHGNDAVDRCAQIDPPPDLLITDVIMPGMNGRELADYLSGRIDSLKVLYISGYADNMIAQHGVLAPGVHFLQKPFTVTELTQAARHALDE